jgi:ADP-ribosyl-[dinitrogen reductase] hydrolase
MALPQVVANEDPRAARSTIAAWTSDLSDRALGAYLGFALGDAFGATVEFMTPGEIHQKYGTHQNIVGGGWLKLARGSVTDDTTMSLALGDAIVAHPEWDLRAVADAFVAWFRARPIDCGNTCRRGIQRYIVDGSVAGWPNEGDAGNGAVMRNLPVVLATLNDAARFERWTLDQCRFTHNHPLSDAAALAFGRLLRSLLSGEGHDAQRTIGRKLVEEHPVFRFEPYPGRASGYVVDTVQTVLYHFFAESDFEACLIAAVNRGEDADTNGALLGMLAGASCGARALPERWLKTLDAGVQARIRDQTTSLLEIAARDS